jgi:nucleoside-diphosphate-sugar epimerase
MGDPYIWMSETGSFFSKENGGILADFGIHYLDLIWYLIGELIPVSYRDDCQGGVEANFEFQLRTEGGIPVKLTLSRTHRLRNSAVFKGEKGELILKKDTFDACLWHSASGNLQGRLSPLKSSWITGRPVLLESCFAEQFSNFLDLVQGRERTHVSAEEASHSIGLVEWAYQERAKKDKTGRQEKINNQDFLPASPVVVTGGTGFIGTHLVEKLKSQGFEKIVVPVRNYNTCADVARFDVKLPLVNLLDFQQVKEMVAGSRYVIHLAYGRDGKEPSRVTIEGTRNVVEAAIACGAESVVVLSTIYVFGLPKDTQIDESWPYRPYGGEYGRSKAKMEEWCLRRARSSGKTRIVVLNPSCVYGPGGKTYTEFPARLASQGQFFWVENGSGLVNFTFIDNLLDAILLAIYNPKAHGERFIINDGMCSWKEFFTPLLSPWLLDLPSYSLEELVLLEKKASHTSYKDIIQLMLSDNEMRKALRNLPLLIELLSFMAKYNPRLREKLSIYGKGNLSICDTPVLPFWLRDLFGPFSTTFSSEKARNILGWMPRIGLKEGRERSIDWLRYIKVL